MAAPLDGIRVLELANWVAVPAATALMADLGAEVIKIEPPEGDVYRGVVLRSFGYDFDFKTNYAFQTDNRGKRSITVDLDKPGGAALVRRLAANVDIFLTNLIQTRQARYGLTEQELRQTNEKLIYVSFTGYGSEGPDAERAGFDLAAFWAATGIMGLIGEPDAPPPLCRGGQGDHSSSLNILAATLAALRMRDLSGKGQHVETTLQASGMWTIAGDLSAALASRQHPPRFSRTSPGNPIWNSYRCNDGNWLLLVMAVPFPNYWPKFATMVGREDWLRDYGDVRALRAASRVLTAEIEAILATHDRQYWQARLDDAGLIWAPVATLPDVVDNTQARAMGWFAEVTHPQHGPFETLDTPFKLHGSDTGARGPAPDIGQHTAEVLNDFGLRGDEITALAADGVFG